MSDLEEISGVKIYEEYTDLSCSSDPIRQTLNIINLLKALDILALKVKKLEQRSSNNWGE